MENICIKRLISISSKKTSVQARPILTGGPHYFSVQFSSTLPCNKKVLSKVIRKF